MPPKIVGPGDSASLAVMSDVLVGALTVLLATNPPNALSNLVQQKTGIAVPMVQTNDPVTRELEAIMAEDDQAQADIDQWIDEADKPDDPAAALAGVTLRGRIQQRIEPIKERYRTFLRSHPDRADGFLAYGSFLNEFGEEIEAIENWEKARKLDPKNPAPWNNLANAYAHVGPVEKSFGMYEEAIRLNPDEPVYLHNFGTLVFLFRRDATNYFKCDEQAVFERAFGYYRKAIELDPLNFRLAADVAQTYYGWNVPKERTNGVAGGAELKLGTTALQAWTNALTLAPSDYEREGVHLHFARWNIRLGRYDEARTNLTVVTNTAHDAVRNRLERTLAELEEARAKSRVP